MRATWQERVATAALLALVVALLALWVRPVNEQGPLQHDAAHYVAMASGPDAAVPAPFAYRVAVPWLVRLSPFTPEHGLRVITLLGVWGTLVLVWTSGRERLGLSRGALACALACSLATPAMTYLFHNPFLTDGAGMFAVTAAVLAWQMGALVAAMLAVALGVLARETVVVTALLWALPPRRVWAALLLLGLGAGLLVLIRLQPAMPEAPGTLALLRDTLTRKGPVKILGDALGTWHVLYLLAGVGIALLPPEQRRTVGFPLGVLALAAAGFSLIALNTSRMFAFLFPALVMALAAFFEAALRCGLRRSIALTGVMLISVPLWAPAWPWTTVPGGALRTLYGAVVLVLALPLVSDVWRSRRVAAA